MAINRKRSKSEAEGKLSCDKPAPSIDFNDAPLNPADVISLPKDEDDLETLVEKISALAEVVSHNRSLAVWTGFAATPNPQRDPFAIAKAEADTRELALFNRFDEIGRRLPASRHFDVLKNVKPLEKENKKTAARYEDMASCVDEIFGTQGAIKENVCWIVENMDAMLPLVKFYLRVKRARRNLLGGQESLTSNELAEYQTVRKIRSVLGVKMQKCRTGKQSDKRLRGYDILLLRRQNLTSPVLKCQREGQMRTEGAREVEQIRVKRQRCTA
ncbi:uncharacterized protein ColSpa_08677 [Colletotrichum spaethianum]|uniref:Uncharacterized protein n=1 Tax=Colletotrichum spaethianum TaxID=700344 RepID=A0AA37UJP7_9PEZI|nr:uncharacterized protein ColSpa_08677 [Colletotrichum spaethianum]GKT48496.1 hypothetical protein ColSpa_08677 [Colletotrichum spaethianum]